MTENFFKPLVLLETAFLLCHMVLYTGAAAPYAPRVGTLQ